MNFKRHQSYAIVALVFLFVGALLHYILISPTISKKVEEAYLQGKQDQLEHIINNINWCDSMAINDGSIAFYKFLDSSKITIIQPE